MQIKTGMKRFAGCLIKHFQRFTGMVTGNTTASADGYTGRERFADGRFLV
ncbi:MAG: hypothetical protein ACK5XN_07950 [Bacteroidota bacterium]|jgi:hypothetical protein